jgi:hypothetical protein
MDSISEYLEEYKPVENRNFNPEEKSSGLMSIYVVEARTKSKGEIF